MHCISSPLSLSLFWRRRADVEGRGVLAVVVAWNEGKIRFDVCLFVWQIIFPSANFELSKNLVLVITWCVQRLCSKCSFLDHLNDDHDHCSRASVWFFLIIFFFSSNSLFKIRMTRTMTTNGHLNASIDHQNGLHLISTHPTTQNSHHDTSRQWQQGSNPTPVSSPWRHTAAYYSNFFYN